MIKFIYKKMFYSQPTYEFNLPAGHSCPFARDCLVKVDRTTGKMQMIGTGYRCYASASERFPAVREHRWKNFEAMKNDEPIILPKGATHIRIHASGDFFSQEYFDKWLQVCRDNPQVKFWAFTKSILFWIRRKNEIPANLTLQASIGSHGDSLAQEHGLKYAKVVKTKQEANDLGLPIDTNDDLAKEGTRSFALLDNFAKK